MKRPTASDSVITASFLSSEGRAEAVLKDDEEEETAEVDEICGSVTAGGGWKKRRLGTEQVRALEQSFKAENKLEPERKARLAHDLGLHPRQVSIWFQNRRARWKSKQLELDFAALKSDYEALQLDFAALRRDNDSLLAELAALKSKLGSATGDAKQREEEKMEGMSTPLPPPADSDSSAGVLTDDDSRLNRGIVYQFQQLFKTEENGFFGGDREPSSAVLFSDEQVTNLDWFYTDIVGDSDIAGGWS